MDKALTDLINCIVNSKEYIDCIEIKKKMESNEDINSRIKRIKVLQQKSLRTPSIEIEEELKTLEKELNDIPLYVMYHQNLSLVNEKISFINDELNDYFYKLLNDK